MGSAYNIHGYVATSCFKKKTLKLCKKMKIMAKSYSLDYSSIKHKLYVWDWYAVQLANQQCMIVYACTKAGSKFGDIERSLSGEKIFL